MPTRTGKAGAAPTPEPLTAAEVPVTRAMLGSLRTELLERMDQSREEAKADHVRLEAKIETVKTELKVEVQEVKTELKTELHGVKAGMHAMQAQMARIELLVEEQNTRNKIVLDALTAILARQNQVEQRVDVVEDTVQKLASAQRRK